MMDDPSFILVLSRHGARTPNKSWFANEALPFDTSFGSLTSAGIVQGRSLGAILYSMYSRYLPEISRNILETNKSRISVSASSSSRAVETARSIMEGWNYFHTGAGDGFGTGTCAPGGTKDQYNVHVSADFDLIIRSYEMHCVQELISDNMESEWNKNYELHFKDELEYFSILSAFSESSYSTEVEQRLNNVNLAQNDDLFTLDIRRDLRIRESKFRLFHTQPLMSFITSYLFHAQPLPKKFNLNYRDNLDTITETITTGDFSRHNQSFDDDQRKRLSKLSKVAKYGRFRGKAGDWSSAQFLNWVLEQHNKSINGVSHNDTPSEFPLGALGIVAAHDTMMYAIQNALGVQLENFFEPFYADFISFVFSESNNSCFRILYNGVTPLKNNNFKCSSLDAEGFVDVNQLKTWAVDVIKKMSIEEKCTVNVNNMSSIAVTERRV